MKDLSLSLQSANSCTCMDSVDVKDIWGSCHCRCSQLIHVHVWTVLTLKTHEGVVIVVVVS